MTRTTPVNQPKEAALEDALRSLFLQGLQGNAAAYRAFLQQASKYLRAFVARRLYGWPDEVEDLVQECLLAMHNQRHTYQPDQPLTAWAHAIARYKLIDVLRAKSAREALHDPLDDEMALFAESTEEAGHARRDLDGLLEALPDKQRLPIRHVKLEGRSVAETATLTGLSESAVKVNIHRGLKALAARIKELR